MNQFPFTRREVMEDIAARNNGRRLLAFSRGKDSKKPASPESPPSISRRHWAIENSPRHVRDVTLREDFRRARNLHKAQTLASFRNTVLALVRRQSFSHVPEGLEFFAEHRTQAIRAIMTTGKRT
jgi:predicted transposase YbfD/YdcC